MNPRISFVPAGTETLNVPSSSAASYPMPAVDAGNQDVTISHKNSQAVVLSFGAGATVSPGAAGMVSVLPGTSVLLTGNPAVLAAAKDQLVQSGPQATAAAAATAVSIWSPGSTTVTISRGTATAVQAF